MGGLVGSVIMGAALVGEHTVSDWQQGACRPDGRGRGCRIDASGTGDLYFTITTRTNTFQKLMVHFLSLALPSRFQTWSAQAQRSAMASPSCC